MATFLGFYLGLHDSNVSVASDGKVFYAKSERVTGVKHHRATLEFVQECCRHWGIKSVDALAFSDGNRNQLGVCELGEFWKETAPLADFGRVPTYCLDHHYCHFLSAWPLADLSDVKYGFAIDGRGDNGIRRCVISDPASSSPELLYADPEMSMGGFLELVGRHMGLSATPRWSVDLAGKVMGAQAYGHVDQTFVDGVDLEEIGTKLESLLQSVPWRGAAPVNTVNFFNFDNPSFRDWLSSVHRIIEKETVQWFKSFAGPDDNIVYSGGCAQNVICNDTLERSFSNLTIPPHSYDGGLSLGAVEFLRRKYNEDCFNQDGFPYWQLDNEPNIPSDSTIKKTAEMLAGGQIVGWFQGSGEVGPRALGNRSILMDPSLKNGKTILNDRVKHREIWRPYGATILSEHTIDWFDLDGESPYMLRSVVVPETRRSDIASVVHVDGTCRIQTLTQKNNPVFARLLEEFFRLSGLPLLLNTSLNGGGQPIFGQRDQCLDLLKNVDLDAVVCGDDIFHK